MSNEFDPYRDALVVETETVFPPECDDLSAAERQRIAELLHAAPQEAVSLEYVRQHSGFCRRIVVTPDDVERVTAK